MRASCRLQVYRAVELTYIYSVLSPGLSTPAIYKNFISHALSQTDTPCDLAGSYPRNRSSSEVNMCFFEISALETGLVVGQESGIRIPSRYLALKRCKIEPESWEPLCRNLVRQGVSKYEQELIDQNVDKPLLVHLLMVSLSIDPTVAAVVVSHLKLSKLFLVLFSTFLSDFGNVNF